MPYHRAVLEILSEAPFPLGARIISQKLADDWSVCISQSAVGRLLSELDRDGLTENFEKKGRALSQRGRAELDRLRSQEQQTVSLENLKKLLTNTDWETLVGVQEARLVIEPSLAAFAAENAVDQDLSRMEKILSEFDSIVQSCSNDVDYGDAFHIELARSARKPILEAAFNLICPQRQWKTMILGFVQEKQRGSNYITHRDIYNAVRSRDKEKAAQLMRMHLYSVYLSLKEYLDSNLK